jgi:hypothetical protein
MTKQAAITKLERNGYEITICFSGSYIASKNQRHYKACSLNGLIKLIF